MEEIETVGIRAFGDSVSAFIRKASLGVKVLISDRGKVVAELRKPTLNDSGAEGINPAARQLISQGKLRLGNNFRVNLNTNITIKQNSINVLDDLRKDI